MNFFLIFAYFAVIFLIVAIPLLLVVSYCVNRWLLKRRLKLRYRILFSMGTPVLLVSFTFLYIYYAPYRTSNMDEWLAELVPEFKLPPYSITEFSSVYVGGDDCKDTYQIVFKKGKDVVLRNKLDSLVTFDSRWKRKGNEYVYDTIFYNKEIVDSIIVRPLYGTATIIEYKW